MALESILLGARPCDGVDRPAGADEAIRGHSWKGRTSTSTVWTLSGTAGVLQAVY